jgi:hypothetical protein
LQNPFTLSFGKIEGHARRKFHYLHGDDLDEAVAETVALCWQAYHRLFMQGRPIDDKRGAIAVFAAQGGATGARLVGQNPINDVMSPTFRHGHSLGPPREDEWTDGSPAQQAILNADFAAFLDTLDDRRRAVAELLASGFSTADVGRMRGVTRSAIHYDRKDLIAAWREFFGDDSVHVSNDR